MVGGAAPHGQPQVTQEGFVGKGGERGTMWSGREGKEWTNYVEEDRRVFFILWDWNIAALDLGVWYSTVCEGGVSGREGELNDCGGGGGE